MQIKQVVKHPTKICHIISGDLWAGAEVMAYQLIKDLNRIDHLQILVILLNQGALAEKLIDLGIKVVVIDETRLDLLTLFKEIKKNYTNYKPAVIHTHRYKENLLAYWAWKSDNKAKLVTTQHGKPEPFLGLFNFKHTLIQKYNLRVLKKYFDKVVVVSEDIKNYFVSTLAFGEKKIEVIHNGIEIPQDHYDKKRKAIFTVGSCGRLFPVKDYPLLVEIAKECLAKGKNIHFKLAGDGPEEKKLKGLVERYGLNGSFDFLGHVDDMPEFYKGLDLYINTSLHEGIPMSVLEAMSYGLPVVAPKVGGLPEIIDDQVEGFLINEREPSLFAEKCLLFQKEQELWNRMSNAAREKVGRSFSLDTMVHKYYRLYRPLL